MLVWASAYCLGWPELSAEFIDINYIGNSVAYEGKTGRFTAAAFIKLRVWFVMTNALFRLVLFTISMVCLCSNHLSLKIWAIPTRAWILLSMEASFCPFEHHNEGWTKLPVICCDSWVETVLLETVTPPIVPVHMYLWAELHWLRSSVPI